MSDSIPCAVCDGGYRDAVDTLLYLGREFREVAKELRQPREFEDAVRFHVFNKHVRECARDTYGMLLTTYIQDVTRMRKKELSRAIKEQSVARLNLCDRGMRWSLEQIAKIQGYNTPGRINLNPKANNLIEALNAFAEANPDAAKRVREVANKEKPVLIEGPKREAPKKPTEQQADERPDDTGS